MTTTLNTLAASVADVLREQKQTNRCPICKYVIEDCDCTMGAIEVYEKNKEKQKCQ